MKKLWIGVVIILAWCYIFPWQHSVNTKLSENQTIPPTEFGKPIIMRIGSNVTFPDGMLLTLKEINDSRCKQGQECFWQGELAPLFTATNGKFSGRVGIRLGMVRTKSFSSEGYIFSLENATEDSATIVVSVVPTK